MAKESKQKTKDSKSDKKPELNIKEREFVVPGDVIVESMDYLPGKNATREKDSIVAKRLGVVSLNNRVISVIPLTGAYIPKRGDMVIGEIVDISNGWEVNIKAPIDAFLSLSGVKGYIDTKKTDLSTVYPLGSLIYAKVHSVSKDSIRLSMQDRRCKKIKTGNIVNINPAKVPRLIGRNGSMINTIKEKTGGHISIGQNGMVWFEGGNEKLITKAIELVENESYKDGLTERVSMLLEKEKDKK